jgi:dipeptidyl-peptidase-3
MVSLLRKNRSHLMSEVDLRLPTGLEVGDLHVEKILAGLSPAQTAYATYLSLASWAGFPVLAAQISVESFAIHRFLSTFLRVYPRDLLVAGAGQPGSNLFYLLEYAATFYYNGANYVGFGDTKFLPRVEKDALVELVSPYPALSAMLDSVIDAIYAVDLPLRSLGWPPLGVTSYYSPSDFTEAEQVAVDKLLKAANIHVNNTIIVRSESRYEVKVFSVEKDEAGQLIGEVNGRPVVVTKGEHSEVLRKVNHWLTLARDVALNAVEAEALAHLIKHNETGDINEHILYSELWVKDSDPVVESYHGVIESYRDPAGVRCEYEGFVAAVDPEESRFLHTFVNESAKILPLMPYPTEYERSSFTPPSYNAINILTFCCSGMPIGINIPNYDEIRQHKGFKNVSLINCMCAFSVAAHKFPFIHEEQLPLYIEHFKGVSTLSTAAHELYGHGSGKLLQWADIEKGVPDLLHPNRVVKTYYEEGETFQSVFGGLGSGFEECRAEAAALHLCYKDVVLEMFGVAVEKRLDFKIAMTLDMLHQGVMTLIHYSTDVHQWKQAHAQARFAILRAVLIWGRGAVVFKAINGTYKLLVDPGNFDGVVDAVENLLKHLNYYKAARMPDQAKEFFRALTSFDDFWIEVRKKALEARLPRGVLCGAVLQKTADGYTLVRASPNPPTVFDVAFSISENIEIASQV